MKQIYKSKHLLVMLTLTLFLGCGGESVPPDNDNPGNVVNLPEDGGNIIDDINQEPSITGQNTQVFNMGESIMARKPGTYGTWDYETGTVLRGFEALYKATNDPRFYNYIKATVDRVISEQGAISGYRESDYNIDQIKEGTTLLYLYETTGATKYKTAADTLRQQLTNHPRTNDGGFWHKDKYPWQMWLDGLYMGEPFYAHYSALTGDTAGFDDVLLQLTLMYNHSRDPVTGLLFHGWDESGSASWANPLTQQSPEFWGRSIGWYLMALVDVLDHIPAEYNDHRNQLTTILQQLVASLEPFQDNDGVWWQVTDQPGQSGNWQEASATAMYVYAIAKGIRMGYLDAAHATTAQKGWAGLNRVFVRTNNDNTLTLTGTCEGTGVGGSYNFYIGRRALENDPKGLGPYLMAGVEMELLARFHTETTAIR